jgi:beta-glucosidase
MRRLALLFILFATHLWSEVTPISPEPPPPPTPSHYAPEVVERRVDQLLSKLTQDEKISLLSGDGFDGMSTESVPRLGIPKLVMADGPQGIRAHGPACSFPSGIALAATWDPKLAYEYGAAIGREARARGIHIQLGPGVNIARTPLNGRNFEYYGEDPYLTGEMASQWIRGIQAQGVVATVKHFVGNDEEWRRMEIESLMDEQTLREIYLQPFQKAVREGGVWAFMSAYNKLNGFPSTGNDRLQNGILKQEWDFPGIVMSDWWATQSADSVGKGLDLEMPMGYHVTKESVLKALDEKQLSKEQIDQAVRRLLRMAVSMGFLDEKQERKDLPLDSKENSALALDVATKSIVLLKNSPTLLPLDRKSLRHVVVYGPNAQDTPAVGGGSGGVEPFRKVSFLQGIREALPKGTSVFYAPMPLSTPFSLSNFFELGKEIPEPPRIVNVRRMTCVTEANFTKVTMSKGKRIEISWTHRSPPEGVPKDQEARVTWDAEIEVPSSGNYELLAIGHPEIRLGDREIGNPESYVMTLEKGVSVPLRVTASEVGRGSGRVLVGIRMIPKEATGLYPAKIADAAIVCVGLNPEVEGEGYDRGFALPVAQQQLIEQVAEANPRTIVVLSGGGAVDMKEWIDKVPAVLQTWYLGQSAGTALASILFGDANPSGHLPCTFDRSIEENPSFGEYPGRFQAGKDWPIVNYKEGIFYGYRGYDREGHEPLFPFGFGLSYTSFSLSSLAVNPTAEGHSISVNMTNKGTRSGASVIQLYISLPRESTPRPLRELKGFQRVELNPGESKVVAIPLPDTSLMYWHPIKNSWVLPEGPVFVEVGFSERDIRMKALIPKATPPKSPLPEAIPPKQQPSPELGSPQLK